MNIAITRSTCYYDHKPVGNTSGYLLAKNRSKYTMIINIYLTGTEKKRLNEIKQKYHLSFSTIADIITSVYNVALGDNLNDHYLHNREGTKTSIKPRNWNYEKPSITFTNALKIFCNKEIDKFIQDQKTREKINNMIYREFENTWDENWNGNQLCRFIPKFIKQNPNYVNKLLETK